MPDTNVVLISTLTSGLAVLLKSDTWLLLDVLAEQRQALECSKSARRKKCLVGRYHSKVAKYLILIETLTGMKTCSILKV